MANERSLPQSAEQAFFDAIWAAPDDDVPRLMYADWLMERGAGLVLPNFRNIAEAVQTLLEPATFARYRNNASSIQNQAVFEIPGILDTLLAPSS